jgi:hypothetical protein
MRQRKWVGENVKLNIKTFNLLNMIPHLFYILFFVILLPYIFFRIFKIVDNALKDFIRLWILGAYLWVIVAILVEKNENVYFINYRLLSYNKLLILYKDLISAHIVNIFLSIFIQWAFSTVIDNMEWRFKTYDSYKRTESEYDFVIFNLSNVIITTLLIIILLSPISN